MISHVFSLDFSAWQSEMNSTLLSISFPKTSFEMLAHFLPDC